MRPVERAIMMLLQVLCALTVMFQLANAQMRAVTGAADWPPRYGGKVFMNTVPLSAAVGYVDPEDPSPTIDRQLLPAGSLFVYGGINENAMSNNDVWVSTSSGKSWMLVGGKHSHYASSSIDDRLFSGSCYDHHTGRAYSVGGTPDGRVVERTTRVTSASDGIHWEIMTDNPGFEYRNRAACVVDIKGNLVVAGGNGDGESFNDVWMSTNLGSSFKLISGSRGAAFGRRSGLSMQSFNFSHLETEIIYVVGGEQTGSNDQRKLTNDVYGSRNGGGSWAQITGRASFPARENAQLTITKTGIMIVSGGLGSGGTALNDIWASLDGGISFGRCCSRCFPGRMDHMAIMDSKDSLFILGGTSGEGPDSFNDVWQGTSFADPEAVAERCDLPMPANGVIGLPCFPTDDNCVIPDPDDPDYQSSTGQSGGGGSSSSKGITIEAVLGIVGAIIFSLALLYYIVRRYKTYLEAKRKEREAEMQYLNQGIFSAPTTHTSLIENAYERSDLYQPPQPQPISQPANHPSDF